MRKYFLLAATALLAASTANAAGTNTANLGADAELQFAAEYTCDNLSFGKITINSSKKLSVDTPVSLTIPAQDAAEATALSNQVTAVDGEVAGICEGIVNANGENWFDLAEFEDDTIELENGTGGSATVALTKGGNYIGGTATFKIPDNTVETLTSWAGEYTGNIILKQTY